MNFLSLLTTALFLFTLLSMQTALAAPRFRVLPSLVGRNVAEPYAISDDGRVVVGLGEDRNFEVRAIWYESGKRTRQVVPFLASSSQATGVSADGSVIVGFAPSAAGDLYLPFYWNRQEGFVAINADPEFTLVPYGLSSDGRVVVGSFYESDPATYYEKPFRWSAEHGFEPLENLDNRSATALAASQNGNVIVGSAASGEFGPTRACRWLAEGKAELLGGLGGDASNANGVSPDGTVIVGNGQTADTSYHAFRWTFRNGMRRLDTNANYIVSNASAVSARGHIVGSFSSETNSESAFLWTPETGLRPMDEIYASELPSGWHFVTASDISADGRWIVGIAGSQRRGSRGYILDTGRVSKAVKK